MASEAGTDNAERGRGLGPQIPDASTIVSSVRTLVDVMQAGSITELDVSFGKVSIRLRSGTPGLTQVATPSTPSHGTEPVAASRATNHEQHITSPMVGTFYASSTPGAPPYVKVGDHIEVGQTVGIVEAMKIMNEIAADRAGLVTAVHVENGEAVEYGSPIVSIDPTRAGGVTVVGTGT